MDLLHLLVCQTRRLVMPPQARLGLVFRRPWSCHCPEDKSCSLLPQGLAGLHGALGARFWEGSWSSVSVLGPGMKADGPATRVPCWDAGRREGRERQDQAGGPEGDVCRHSGHASVPAACPRLSAPKTQSSQEAREAPHLSPSRCAPPALEEPDGGTPELLWMHFEKSRRIGNMPERGQCHPSYRKKEPS